MPGSDGKVASGGAAPARVDVLSLLYSFVVLVSYFDPSLVLPYDTLSWFSLEMFRSFVDKCGVALFSGALFLFPLYHREVNAQYADFSIPSSFTLSLIHI